MGRKKKGNVNSRGYYTFKKTISTKFDGTPIKKVFYSKKSKADAQRKADEYVAKQQLSIQLGETLNPVSVNFKNCAYMWLESVKSSISDVTYNNNSSKEIQQGVTATVSIAYILQDTESPVDITVEEYNIWTKGDYIINKTLDIKNMVK